MQSKNVIISGRVQGVGYRAWTEQQARQLGLTGRVRNQSDGSVQALLQGQDATVATLLEKLWEGPSAARVTQVEITDTSAPEYTTFEVDQ